MRNPTFSFVAILSGLSAILTVLGICLGLATKGLLLNEIGGLLFNYDYLPLWFLGTGILIPFSVGLTALIFPPLGEVMMQSAALVYLVLSAALSFVCTVSVSTRLFMPVTTGGLAAFYLLCLITGACLIKGAGIRHLAALTALCHIGNVGAIMILRALSTPGEISRYPIIDSIPVYVMVMALVSISYRLMMRHQDTGTSA